MCDWYMRDMVFPLRTDLILQVKMVHKTETEDGICSAATRPFVYKQTSCMIRYLNSMDQNRSSSRELEDSLSYSQKLATGPHPLSDNTLYLNIILMYFFYV
jgi:hypothetical protein